MGREAKQKKEYILDPQGKKIYDRNKRQYRCNSVPATDWNEQTKAEEWRAAWAEICNQFLEQNNSTKRGILNPEIEISNQKLRQLKARIGKLQNWLKEEQKSTTPTTPPLPTTFKVFCHARHRLENRVFLNLFTT